MEKQRAQTASIQKDSDRLRSERDRATYQFAQLAASVNGDTFVSPNLGPPRSIPNSASAIGLGIEDHHKEERQRVSGTGPAPILKGNEAVETSSERVDKPTITRYHSDSNVETMASQETKAYARETGTTSGEESGRSTPSLSAPSPAFNPKSPARSRAVLRTDGPPHVNTPPLPEHLRTPLSVQVIVSSDTSPSEDTPRAALLPSASITPTRPSISDSRISYDPAIEEYLAMIASPETGNLPTILAPQAVVAGHISRPSPHPTASHSRPPPVSPLFSSDGSSAPRSSHLLDEPPMTGSPERAISLDDGDTADTERRPTQSQSHEVKPPGAGRDTPGPSRQHSYTSDSQEDHPPIYPRPAPTLLDRPPPKFAPQLLPFTRCSITSSKIAPNALGKDVLCFIVSVSVRAPGAYQTYSWNVAKLFSAFLELDTIVRSKIGGRKHAKAAGIASLPDGKSWKDFAPSKVDQRKTTLEIYLQSLLTAPLSDKTEICGFLLTDVMSRDVAASNTSTEGGVKSGYLTKRGKALGG